MVALEASPRYSLPSAAPAAARSPEAPLTVRTGVPLSSLIDVTTSPSAASKRTMRPAAPSSSGRPAVSLSSETVIAVPEE